MSNHNPRYIPDRLGRLGQGTWSTEKPRDPFGRMFEPEHEQPFDLSKPFDLSEVVGDGGKNARADVAKIETLLGLAGALDLKKTDGPTGYTGQRLLEGIRTYQKQNGLSVDGRLNPDGPTIKALSQSLQSMGRNGDTVLAHLTPEEAGVLHAITDGGSINPKTGLLEFWPQGGRDGPEEHSNNSQSSGNGSTGNNGRGVSNADIVGEHMKAMHNAREATKAAAGSQATGGNDLGPFGGSGPDISGIGLKGKTTAAPEPERTLMEAFRATLARTAKQELQKKSAMTRPNLLTRPQVNTLEDLHTKKEDNAAMTHNWGMQKQTRPSMTQQVKNVTKAREETKKAVKSASKPAPNPYAGDIAAMVEQMSKMKSPERKANPTVAPPSETKSFLDMLFDSFNDFLTDPNNAPTHTPPLDPPPSGPSPVPAKKDVQKNELTAAMLAGLLALMALGQLLNSNKNGGSIK